MSLSLLRFRRPAPPAVEPPAFEHVYRDHVAFVFRQLRSMGVADSELDDATQEVFVLVHRKLSEFDARKGAMTTWLYGIARGVASNTRRASQRRKRREDKSQAPAPLRGPDAVLEASQAAELVERFLDGLPAERRVVFELVEIEGMRATEVADALSINANTVYTRLRAARLAFRAFVDELSEGNDA